RPAGDAFVRASLRPARRAARAPLRRGPAGRRDRAHRPPPVRRRGAGETLRAQNSGTRMNEARHPMSVRMERTRRIDVLLAEYGESHRNPTNKAIHWIAVPVIAWSVIGILWALPMPGFHTTPYLNWATIVCALAVLYYLTLSIPLAVG